MRRRDAARFPLRRALTAVLAALTVLLCASCGEQGQGGGSATDPTGPTATGTPTGESEAPQEPETSESPEATPSASQSSRPAPRACRDLWRAGQTLPAAYTGCVMRGRTVAPQARQCSSGQSLVEYGGRFYAVPGHQVVDVGSLTSKKYQRVLATCQG